MQKSRVVACAALILTAIWATHSFGAGHSLYAIYERPVPWPPAGLPLNHVIQTNNGWYDAYSITLAGVKVNDLFRLRGHITFTNTSADRVYGECRLIVNDEEVGTRGKISVTYKQPPVSNTLENESRDHAPVHCDGLYIVRLPGDYNEDGVVDAADYTVWRDKDGSPQGYTLWKQNFGKSAANTTFVISIKLQSFAANPGGMTPTVLVENGHGHLVAEHYRKFDSFASAAASGARVLTEIHYQHTPQVLNYPSSPPVGQEYDTMKTWPDTTFAYQLDIPVTAGDRLRFFGMATGYPIYPNQVHDGPVLGIWMKDPTYTTHTLYSPWVAEGFSPAYTINPMWNDAVTGVATSTSMNRYWLGVHGTLVRPQGVGGEVAQPLGYFYALKYQPQTDEGRTGGRHLTRPYELTTSATSMLADGTWIPLISRLITVATDEIVKLSGATLFEHPGIMNDKVTTHMVLRVRDSLGNVVAQTPISYKHMSRYTKYNTLRSDLLLALNAGEYYFELLANCPFSGSPTATIDPLGTKLYYESFALPEGVAPLGLVEEGGGAALSDSLDGGSKSKVKRVRRKHPRPKFKSIRKVGRPSQSLNTSSGSN